MSARRTRAIDAQPAPPVSCASDDAGLPPKASVPASSPLASIAASARGSLTTTSGSNAGAAAGVVPPAGAAAETPGLATTIAANVSGAHELIIHTNGRRAGALQLRRTLRLHSPDDHGAATVDGALPLAPHPGDPGICHAPRYYRKNRRSSPTNRSGTSIAGKCPPRSYSVHDAAARSGSRTDRTLKSPANTATPSRDPSGLNSFTAPPDSRANAANACIPS